MTVPTTMFDLSTTAASNSPAGTEAIGTSLDDYLRGIQAIVKADCSAGADIASGSTITPPAAGQYFNVTGTTGITAIASTYSWNGRTIRLKFAGAVTITHNASTLILLGGANITTAAGDVLDFTQESAGTWRNTAGTNATGTGKLVRATSPTLVTPVLGVATATSINSVWPSNGAGANSLVLSPASSHGTAAGPLDIAIGGAAAASSSTGSPAAIAIGSSASASQVGGYDGSIAMGDSASAENGGMALGVDASASAGGYASNGIAIGKQAAASLFGNVIAIGPLAAASGDGAIAIGASAASAYSNSSSVGGGAAATGANQITLGNSSIATLRCQVTSITALSDERDKTNIQDMPPMLGKVMLLRPVDFEWNMRDGGKVGVKDSGFIAQELQEVDNEHLKLVYAENPDKLEASYGRLIPVLVKAIQELKKQFDDYVAAHQ